METEQSRLAVRAVVLIYREFEQLAKRADITMAQYRLLRYLRNGPKRAGAIAAAAELAKPTISLALGALKEKGWVESAPDADGRASAVAVTPAGLARILAFETDMAQVMAAMLGDADMETLGSALAAAHAVMAAAWEARMKKAEPALVE